MSAVDWKVLIIDDEEGIRKVLSITLEDAGFHVMTAPDGESGIRLFDEGLPQIVLTDIRMPGMDGLEVLRTIKGKDPDKEVIVITAFGEMDMAVQALQLDASDFITKPIRDEALFVALERAKKRYLTRKELNDYARLLENKWLDTAEELAKTFHFQSNLIESSMDGIIGCDRDGIVRTFNKSLEGMLGYSKDEVIRQMSFTQFFPVGSGENLLEQLRSEGYGGKNRLHLFETHLITRNSEKIPAQLSLTVLFEDGKEVGLVGFVRDLREIRRLEQQFADQTRLLHQHKMMSLGRLAASVVHEINNPLAGILNYVRLMNKILHRGTPDRTQLAKFQDYVTIVEGEISRCSKIVSNLLAFSRKSKMEFADVAVNELLEKCMMLSQHKLTLQNIELQAKPAPENPFIRGDMNQLQQALINLIFNAIDAMPEGGTLSLESVLKPREALVEIKVTDTGCGIAKEELGQIFDPFYTTKTEGEGLGLGLSTVYGIIDRHKGTISVESRPGKGSVFTIKIPVVPRDSMASRP